MSELGQIKARGTIGGRDTTPILKRGPYFVCGGSSQLLWRCLKRALASNSQARAMSSSCFLRSGSLVWAASLLHSSARSSYSDTLRIYEFPLEVCCNQLATVKIVREAGEKKSANPGRRNRA